MSRDEGRTQLRRIVEDVANRNLLGSDSLSVTDVFLAFCLEAQLLAKVFLIRHLFT